VQALDEDAQLQLAIQMSLAQTEPAAPAADDGSDAELQLAIQMSLRDLKDTGTAGLPVVVVDSSPDPAVVGAESSGLDGQDATEMPAVSTDEMPGRSVEVAEQTDMKLLSSKTEESPPSADPQPSVDDPTPESPLTTAAAASDSASMSSGDSSSVPISESASMASSSSSITPLIGKRRLASLGYDTDTDLEQQYDEIALAAELSQLADTTDTPGVIQVPVSSQEAKSSRSRRQSTPRREAQSQDSGDAGDIIGIAEFEHDPELLARHLSSVLAYWHGTRDPQGVSLAHVRRCGWCEFEEGCEWR
jgi:exonuclease V